MFLKLARFGCVDRQHDWPGGQSAAPAASATSMLALKYGADYSYGTGLSIGTTIVSMITMPLVLALAMAYAAFGRLPLV